MAGGWHTSCHPISKMHIVEEGPGETPSALRWLSSLNNSFLTEMKPLAKTSAGALSVPLLMSMSESFSVAFHTVIKLSYTKGLEWPSPVPGPEAKSSSEITNLTPFTISYHSPLQFFPTNYWEFIFSFPPQYTVWNIQKQYFFKLQDWVTNI